MNNTLSTNKLKSNCQTLRKFSQPDLHVKILNLVANRISPAPSDVALQKQICGANANYYPSSSSSTKKNSLATTRAKQSKIKCNKTVCEGNEVQNNKNIQNNLSQIEGLHKDLFKKHKRKLQTVSKVISLSIDCTKIGDFTIDLRRQMPNEFVNIKMMNKLKRENLQKQQRIIQLQRQIVELHQRIVQLSFNLQSRIKDSLDEQMLISSSSRRVKSIRQQNSQQLNQAKGQIKQQFKNYVKLHKQQKLQSNQYQYLLRMLKNQALELQNCNSKLNIKYTPKPFVMKQLR